jgi:hypothetical protein
VVDHVSGVFDETGGTLVSEDTGVAIHIPHGALPPGEPTEIYFKVSKIAFYIYISQK